MQISQSNGCRWFWSCIIAIASMTYEGSAQTESKGRFDPALFRKDNLVAWCIVPFDSEKRTPEQRAQMLDELGIRKLAYDYRAEHVPTFEREIMALKEHGIELTAWWFPTVLNEEAKGILALLKKHDLHPQLWVTGGGAVEMDEVQTQQFIRSESARIREIALAAAEVNCSVGLYNHGGWFGVPENQIRLLKEINLPNVGIVFNLHHAHDQLHRLPAVLEMLKPYLMAVNLNGMQRDGELVGKKILPIGIGEEDASVVQTIGASGYRGVIGILNHTDEDARTRLVANMDGLHHLIEIVNAPSK